MNKKTPIFSVIILTYNSEKFIKRSLESVLNQTFLNFEVIIVDNSSTDNTVKIIKDYNKDFITILSVKNNGILGYSRNKGVKAASGTWISFLDSDDTWSKNKLMTVKEAIDKFNNAVLISNDENVVKNKKIIKRLRHSTKNKDFFLELLLNGTFLSPSAVTIKQKAYIKVGGFSEEKQIASVEDYEFWLRLSRFQDYRYSKNKNFIFLNTILGECHLHGSNMSSNISHHINAGFIVKEHFLSIHQKAYPKDIVKITNTK